MLDAMVTRAAMYKHFTGMCDKMQGLADAGKGLPRDFFRELDNVKRFRVCYEKSKQELLGNVVKRVKEMDSYFKKTIYHVARQLCQMYSVT